jgi:acyl carrier protein
MADMSDQIRSVLYATVSATFRKPLEELDDDIDLTADLGAKSVNLVRIIAAIEDEFGLDVSFAEFRRRKTIGEAIDYLVQLCGS